MRKIGKIETSDWNIKEIEKKIKENKLGKPIVRDKEKVPKWSREQFVARQTKLEKLDRQDSAEGKLKNVFIISRFNDEMCIHYVNTSRCFYYLDFLMFYSYFREIRRY